MRFPIEGPAFLKWVKPIDPIDRLLVLLIVGALILVLNTVVLVVYVTMYTNELNKELIDCVVERQEMTTEEIIKLCK